MKIGIICVIHFPESESENTMEKQFHGQASESLRLGLLLAVTGFMTGFMEEFYSGLY